VSRALAVAALLALAACGGKDGGDAAMSDSSAAMAQPEVDTTMALVSRGASIAIAVEAMPAKADSILAAAGMTADEYEALMYRIAADTLLSRLYQNAVQNR